MKSGAAMRDLTVDERVRMTTIAAAEASMASGHTLTRLPPEPRPMRAAHLLRELFRSARILGECGARAAEDANARRETHRLEE